MQKLYWYKQATYQDKLCVAGILIWLILGTWALLNSWPFISEVQTPLVILPANMIVLTIVYWFIQNKRENNSRQERQWLIFFALTIISVSAVWVYEF